MATDMNISALESFNFACIYDFIFYFFVWFLFVSHQRIILSLVVTILAR